MSWGMGARGFVTALVTCVWAGAADAQTRTPPAARMQAVAAAVRDYVKGTSATYAVGFADLNDDGKDEAIVHFTSGIWCITGGCSTLVLEPDGANYRFQSLLLALYLPIRVLDTKTNGWREIANRIPGGESAVAFNGVRYPGGWYAHRKLGRNKPGKVVLDPKTPIQTLEPSGG